MSLEVKIKEFIVNTIQDILPPDLKYQIILFGSYAKGIETKFSDIDIAIVSKKPIDTGKWSMIEEIFEESNIKQRIDVIDYQRVQASFQIIIDQEGLILKEIK